VLDALSSLPRVELDGVAEGDIVVVDGGSRGGSAELLARVAAHAKPDTALAVATTDEAPVATLGVGLGRDEYLVGLHIPLAPRPGVVEVVAARRSSPDVVATVAAALTDAGHTAIPCRDRPGHIVDMLLLPHLGDAVRMVGDGYASYDDVDTAMTLGCGYPHGPIAMVDAIGADDLRSSLLHLAAATHLPALAPAPLLDELAAYGSAR
jgi:3-hydroxybutyryl-CoA dehydrogenase